MEGDKQHNRLIGPLSKKRKKKIGPKVEQENNHSIYSLLLPTISTIWRRGEEIQVSSKTGTGGGWDWCLDACSRQMPPPGFLPPIRMRPAPAKLKVYPKCPSLNTVPAKRNQVRSGLDGILLGLSASASR